MHGPGLIFSRDFNYGKRRRVSPYLFPQFGVYNKYFIPSNRDLPSHGLVTRIYAFDFGFSQGNPSIAPMDTVDFPLVIGRDFLVWSITQVYQTAATTDPPVALTPGANASPGFLVNFLHTHEGVQRQWANKSISDGESGGDGRYPLMLKEPALLLAGDTLTCSITSLVNATMLAQICLTGGEFDTETYGVTAGS